METWNQQFDAYPHWLVWTSLVLTAIAVVWVLGRVMTWVLKLVLTLAVLAAVGGLIVWMLA